MLQVLHVLVMGIPAIISAIIGYVGRKLGVAAASIASFVIITAGFIVCINAILQHVLSLIALPSWAAAAIGMFIPINFAACLSAIVSSWICRAAYDMAKFKIIAINNAN